MRITIGGQGLAGKIVSTLFCGVFLSFGLFFTGLVVRGFINAARIYGWTASRCTVEASDFETNPEGGSGERFGTRVRYRYNWNGAQHEAAAESFYSDAGEAQRHRDRYVPGEAADCFVNPASADESRLARPSLWGGLIILFPLLFVAAGGVPIVLIWRRAPAAAARPEPQALTATQKAPAWAGCVLPAFFGVFFFAGLAVLWWLMLSPLQWISRARSWQTTPCTVVSSSLAQQSDSDGTTYRIEIVYRYLFGGREYQSSRYNFQTAWSGDASSKQAVVDRYTPGEACTCFVDPAEPSRAVLDRGFRKSYWAGLLGLPFLLAGLGGLLWVSGALRGKARPAVPAQGRFSGWREGALAEPVVLRPKSGPWKKLAGTLFINVFWNGIVSVFIVFIAKDWRAGGHDWMPILILTPFTLIGLALLAGLPYALLGLLNPRPWIELERSTLAPGDAVGARFRLSGRASRLDRLTVALEGRESVTITTRSGNTTSISSRDALFHRSVLFESPPGGTPRDGAFTLAVPADTMHTLAAPSNRVGWRLSVHGDIARWPDIEEEFEILVLPREVDA